MRKILLGVISIVGLLLAYLLLWRVPVDPVAWTPPEAPALTGPYAPNTRLAAVERLGGGAGVGPEDVALDGQGRIYGGMADGRILRFLPDGSQPEIFADTEGRPLGLHFDAAGNLVVADAYKGLLSISPQGSITVLTTEQGGVPFRLTDDVDIAADGTIYFSDASSKFSIADDVLDVLEHGANGRLLAYDPASQETRLLLSELHFANGVAVSPDQSFVLVAETTEYRVLRYWLTGERAGQLEVFIENLPGFPDGISSNGEDTFWLALFTVRIPQLDALLPQPFVRKILARAPWLQPTPQHHAFVLGLDLNGRVVHNLQDASGDAYAPVTSAQEHEGMLYLGSLTQDSVGRLPVPEDDTQAVRVFIETELGEIELEVDAVRAPVTAANFLRYVDGGYYDGGRFHRTVRLDNQPDNKVVIEVVQAGINPSRAEEEFAPIPLERTRQTGLKHTDGAISMARLEPDTVTSDFFICIGDQPSLDFGGARNPDGQGFAAFGRVVRGMEVVRKIQAAPAEGQTLTPTVRIVRARRTGR